MGLDDIQSYIETVEHDATLREEQNFEQRLEVIDFIDFQLIEQLETTAPSDELTLLKTRAANVKAALEAIDLALFQKLRAAIRTAAYTGQSFKSLVGEYVDLNIGEEIGYDTLDVFINGLSHFQAIPEQTKILEPEMVYYQKTPARIIFELAAQSHFTKDDVFFDLGAGLGQVAILVHLLAGSTVKGIEFEPAFCDYARNSAAELNLSNITFTNVDARQADYAAGTVFFMFTPFRGEILQEVLAQLKKESLQRKIKLITFGPCTPAVAMQPWLEEMIPWDHNIHTPAVFTSF